MANTSFPPPQAYTKEVLTEAYSWFIKQPDAIKERATTPDKMVALYLRYKRHTGDKVSAEEFKSELINLKGMMDENFASTASPQPPPMTQQMQQQYTHQTPQYQQPPQQQPAWQNPSQSFVPPDPNTVQSHQNVDNHVAKAVENSMEHFDSQTQMILYDVKMRFNLSSESEALRLLVRMGYSRVKEFLPSDDNL